MSKRKSRAQNVPDPKMAGPQAVERLDRAREVFKRDADAGGPTPESTRALLGDIDRYGAAMGWDRPEVREQIRTGRYRAPGFVVEDEVGYDRELAKRSVGPGWASLVDEVFNFRDAHAPSVRIVQVKEKFATLTIYIEGPRKQFDRLEAVIEDVGGRSATICEQCGAPGVLRRGGWWKTLCDAHAAGARPLPNGEDER